jgi:hypothetical protein
MDPRWLEILKASGWQTAAIATACLLILAADRFEFIPKLDPWMIQLTAAAMAICALLAVASCISKSSAVYNKVAANIRKRRALAYAIDTLNPDETDFLKGQINKSESTVQLHPFNAGSMRAFVHQSGLYQGLQSKGIVTISAADPEGKIQTITVTRVAWKILKNKFKDATV